jgi:hypothetical protein
MLFPTITVFPPNYITFFDHNSALARHGRHLASTPLGYFLPDSHQRRRFRVAFDTIPTGLGLRNHPLSPCPGRVILLRSFQNSWLTSGHFPCSRGFQMPRFASSQTPHVVSAFSCFYFYFTLADPALAEVAAASSCCSSNLLILCSSDKNMDLICGMLQRSLASCISMAAIFGDFSMDTEA